MSNHLVALHLDGQCRISCPKRLSRHRRRQGMLLVFCSESLCPGQADMQVHASRGHASPHNPGPPGALTAQIEAQKRERIDPVAGTLGGLSAARGGLPNESPLRQCLRAKCEQKSLRCGPAACQCRRDRCARLHTNVRVLWRDFSCVCVGSTTSAAADCSAVSSPGPARGLDDAQSEKPLDAEIPRRKYSPAADWLRGPCSAGMQHRNFRLQKPSGREMPGCPETVGGARRLTRAGVLSGFHGCRALGASIVLEAFSRLR
jgi:hypothetical protein